MLWRFFSGKRGGFLAVLVPVAAFLALNAGGEAPAAGLLGSVAATAAAPFQAATASAFSFAGGALEGIFGGGRLRRENEALRLEVSRLRREVTEGRERAAAASRLERLLEFREQTGFQMTAARVIGHDPSALYRSALLNRGAADGVRRNQAVLSPDGVVGRVIRVFPRTALALLLTDRSSGVDAIVQRTRDQGVVQGTGGESCALKYLARQAEVVVGDEIVTSGVGGAFPKGIRVGRVSRVEKGGEVFQSVEVLPAADLDRLEEVWLLDAVPQGGS